jgi:excisionase family DNA binding protein
MIERNTQLEAPSPWWRIDQAARYAQCGRRALYRAVAAGRLQAARVNGRRELRFRREWIDRWMQAAVVNREVS